MIKYLFGYYSASEYNQVENEKKRIEKKYKKCLEQIKKLKMSANTHSDSNDSLDSPSSTFITIHPRDTRLMKKIKNEIVEKKKQLKKIEIIKKNPKVNMMNTLELSLSKIREAMMDSE